MTKINFSFEEKTCETKMKIVSFKMYLSAYQYGALKYFA